ncbi:MAG: 30S ribosomal protein S4e [Thermoplasmatales archaeon]|nr:30S ribosomal protein S4e [Thermoplasmatales archaeon]
MSHLKRLNAPRSWQIERKVTKWAVRPSPGPHGIEESIPLLNVIRDYLSVADTAREAKKLISARKILVDGKARIDYRFPCGLMDVVTILPLDAHYRVLIDSRGILRLVKIDEEMAKWKLCRIENKTTLRGGKTQLNLHDGRNIIVSEDKYKTGDVLKISIPKQEIIEHIPLQEGYISLITGGSHIGKIERIKKLIVTRTPLPNIVELESFSTIKDYVFPVGKDEPLITLPQVSIYG